MDTELQQFFESVLEQLLTVEQKQVLAAINSSKTDNQ